jgi:hypothetical protein
VAIIEAVIVLPFKPNEIPLLFEKTRFERLLLVVPAETLMFVRLVATDAVIVEASSPNEMP